MSTTGELRDCLRVRYPLPEWALFFEVACGTGLNGGRYADAVAMNLFPSRGLALHGFEIKASRSDWRRELKDPKKSIAVQSYCDFWWLVTDKDIAREEEIPLAWGWIERRGTKLFVAKKAPELQPTAINRSFAAAIIRRAGEVDAEQRNAAMARELEAERTRFREEDARRRQREHSELGVLKQAVAEFEEASGIKLGSSYDGAKIGKATLELFSSWQSLPDRLAGLSKQLEVLKRDVDQASAEFGPAEIERQVA